MKSISIKNLLLTCAMLMSTMAFAQDKITVTGTVSDADTGEPLIGVSILENGSISNGVITDLDGNYSITVDPASVLDISYIGYETVKENVSGRSTINIGLHVQTEYMEEVVVVGYAVMKKRDVTGAISKVSSKDLNAMPVASGSQALQGRVAGMQVSAATGAPGADISVRIRGVGSIYSDNSPLYIIDGIPSADGMNNISPNDIENISVLKDASSAAIYGSRATNGVILITTKQGKSGDARISYNGTVNLQVAANFIDMANTAEYVEIYNEAQRNDGNFEELGIPDSVLSQLDDVDYVRAIFRPALMHTHELSVSGGTDKIRYLVSGSYYDQDGTITAHQDLSCIIHFLKAGIFLKISGKQPGRGRRKRYVRTLYPLQKLVPQIGSGSKPQIVIRRKIQHLPPIAFNINTAMRNIRQTAQTPGSLQFR